ncbi:hypothetical protein ITX31_11700 [Arthrobacter gandavensis]|uniref:hypothetical protein n=1 Tax=Arthrobacter gandavensis TaxID=169960 RepID=UPI00188FA351|nr:hypothetical protein [Arthrobacter gandavensis]MBF4994771.1 hypothetical protein [Arthrobacter gandavensis]
MTAAARSRRALLLLGLLLLLMGTVSVAVNLPYLPDGGGYDAAVPWIAAGCGVFGIAGSIWCLVQYRRVPEPEKLVLRDGGYRTFNQVMLCVCVVLLLVGLALDQPTISTGLPSLLAFNFARNLFQPRSEAAANHQQDAGRPGSSAG